MAAGPRQQTHLAVGQGLLRVDSIGTCSLSPRTLCRADGDEGGDRSFLLIIPSSSASVSSTVTAAFDSSASSGAATPRADIQIEAPPLNHVSPQSRVSARAAAPAASQPVTPCSFAAPVSNAAAFDSQAPCPMTTVAPCPFAAADHGAQTAIDNDTGSRRDGSSRQVAALQPQWFTAPVAAPGSAPGLHIFCAERGIERKTHY